MDDQQLLKYSRHILLPQLDVKGQQKLMDASVLIVGLGGLGSPVAMYLAASGIGKLFLNDYDAVDLSNLQRQIIHQIDAVGINKAISAKQSLLFLNPDCCVVELPDKLGKVELDEQIKKVSVVVDCTDNFATRCLLNQLCFDNKKPLVSGAAIRFEGQLTVFHYENESDACYACLYPGMGEDDQSCTANGVLSPLVGVIGSLQAIEAIKLIAGIGETLRNRLMIFDALAQDTRIVRYKRDRECFVCSD
jgi:molybdopterin-synthase adenylyltransferase